MALSTPSAMDMWEPNSWAIYQHRVQDFGGRGWGYVDKLLNKLRKRMKIKEVLARLLAEEIIKPGRKAYHLPGAYRCGKKAGQTPDYWEWGTK
jgi:hypothetical protein